MCSPELILDIEVLVVDDDVELARALTNLLRRHGYVVEQVHQGRAAIDFLSRHCVGLVISDIYMPECDGIELLSFLRSLNPRPPFIAMSGTDGTVGGMLKAAEILGAARTVAKPFAVVEMVQWVRELLGPAENPESESGDTLACDKP